MRGWTVFRGEPESALREPEPSFLVRTFELCDDCGAVLSRTGSCARDACDCSLHAATFVPATA